MENSKKIYIRLTILLISYWAFFASFLGFITTYLLAQGISNTFLSILVALYMLSSFLGSFFWGDLCDKFQTNKKVILFCLLCGAISISIVFFMVKNPIVLVIFYSIMGFVVQPLSTNIDSWLIKTVNNDQGIYGKIRSFGSLSYAITILGCGLLISNFGFHIMLFAGLSFLLVAFIITLSLPDVAPISNTYNKFSFEGVKKLFTIRPYLLLLFLLFFTSLSIAPINSLKVIVMNNVGGNVSHMGVDSFVGVMIQVPLIALAGRTQKISLKVRYLIMTISPLLMLVITYFATVPFAVTIGTCFTNLSYGILLPTMREITENNVDKSVRNIGHNVADAIYNSFAGMISMIYAGAVIDSYGVKTMLAICIIIQLIPITIGSKFFLNDKRRKTTCDIQCQSVDTQLDN